MQSFRQLMLCGGCSVMLGTASLMAQPATQPTRPGQSDRPDARSPAAQSQADRTAAHAGAEKLCLASEHIGKKVQTASKEPIGMLRDLVLDESGQVKYIAVSMQASAGSARATDAATPRPATPGQATPGQATTPDQRAAASRQPGAAAASGELVLIPFSLIDHKHMASAPQEPLTIKIEKEQLAQAPKFSQQQLSETGSSQQWVTQVDSFFRTQSGRSARPDLGDDATRPDSTRPDSNRANPPTTPNNRD